MYLSDKGRLSVFLLNLIKIVDAHGKSYDQGELLRWLAESFWFPTNLLPSERVSWSPIDAHSAKVQFRFKDIALELKVVFNDKNEVKCIETERFMEENRMETWLGEFFEYKEINGVLIPTVVKASWLLENKKHTYVDFVVDEIEYDIPKLF